MINTRPKNVEYAMQFATQTNYDGDGNYLILSQRISDRKWWHTIINQRTTTLGKNVNVDVGSFPSSAVLTVDALEKRARFLDACSQGEVTSATPDDELMERYGFTLETF